MNTFYNCQLAISPINWTNDDMLDLGDHYSFQQILDEMRELGFKGTELGRKYPKDVSRLRQELGSRDLTLTSGWCDILFSDPRASEESLSKFYAHVLFLKQMGCRYVVTADGGGSVHWDPREDRSALGVRKYTDEEWASLCKNLNAAGQFCRAHRMTLVYHIHTGTGVETMEETDRLCAGTDPEVVSLLVDTGHLYYCGVDAAEVIRKYRDRVKYIHLKDVRQPSLDQVQQHSINFNDSVRRGIFTVPGDGAIDFAPVFQALEEANYQGWLVIEAEQDSVAANPIEYAKKALAYIQSLTNLKA
ncbi:myo-inosose-2 dehydratase [Paenibacillus cremeus]|uniref:Myo-inosose-2 dehydratase n=1 Tax=Paenibacillus cremeus TaxID=2163881 RepID=A0A559JKD1_9BACL|nr:myo-inosose-2 dehydratase [Paenibacillus cremeus]TVY00332.1 myo-inosose-2 dehydratase [Paenibacillus cremeus]